jgi:hypothetical protein
VFKEQRNKSKAKVIFKATLKPNQSTLLNQANINIFENE